MSIRSDTPSGTSGARRSDRVGRVLVVVSVSCLLAAIGITVTVAPRSGTQSQPVLDVADATLAPATDSSRSDPTPEPGSEPSSGRRELPLPDRASTSGATIGSDDEPVDDEPGDGASDRSRLTDRLGPLYSAIPEPVAPRPVPVGAVTSSIDLTPYPIRPVGLQEDGQLEIPDETEIGWYRYGATAGRPGATVLAAHVSWNNTTGPFFQLGTMQPGDQITVTLDDGTQRTYQVTERTMYDKNELPRNRIWRTTGDEQLVLITCGGDFNPDIRRYRQNIVIYASPIN
ncbi:MAG: sortase [Ilumatobacter sp.]